MDAFLNIFNQVLSFFQDTNFVIVFYELFICFYILHGRKMIILRCLVFVPYIVLTNNVIGIVSFFNTYLVWGDLHFGYVLYFIVSVFLVWFCFDEKFSRIFFFCTTAYIIENFGSQIGNILNLLFFSGSEYVDIYNTPKPLLYSVIRQLIEIPIIIVVWFFIIKKYKSNYDFRLKSSVVVGIEIVTLFIIIFLNYYGTMENYMNVVARTYAAIVDIFILLFQFALFNENRLKYENYLVGSMLDVQGKQYELSSENIERLNLNYHDLKRQIAALKLVSGEEERRSVIAGLEEAVSIYESKCDTGNKALDVVLTEKMFKCKDYNINFSCVADGTILDFISPFDIYILFSNAMDNAIESVMHAEIANRNISLNIRGVDNGAVILMENYCAIKPKFVDGMPETTKRDKIVHGYGSKSIRAIVEKYNGHLKMDVTNSIFVLKIVFLHTF